LFFYNIIHHHLSIAQSQHNNHNDQDMQSISTRQQNTSPSIHPLTYVIL
jgi:hypothetical protein